MNKNNKNCTVKQINKDIYNKFKVIRKLQNHLYGPYQLYSKNGIKYLGKYLPMHHQYITYRDSSSTIFRYTKEQHHLYIFPLNGQPLSNLLAKVQHQGQLKIWLSKHNSLEDIFILVIKKMISLLEVNQSLEVVLECLRINNGELQYCYDNWMNTSQMIVLQNQNQLENYYFSYEDLDVVRFSADNQEPFHQLKYEPSQSSIIFRIFLMILHLGTSHFKERNYQYGLYKLNQAHIRLKVNYFCSKFNQKGLGSLMKRIMDREKIQIEEICKVLSLNSLNKSRKTLLLSSINLNKPKDSLSKHEIEEELQIKQNYNSKTQLNVSQLVHFSPNRSILSQSKQSNQNIAPTQSKIMVFSNKKSENKLKNPLSHMKFDDKQKKCYFVGKKSKQEALNLRKILVQINEPYASNIKILKYLGLQEYFPLNMYQRKIIQALSNVCINNTWAKQQFQNGSIYFGQMIQSKKEGKGLYLFNTNDFYYGNWLDNYMNGYGSYIFTSGEVYQGELKKGYKDGHGKCIYSDGRQYEGSWTKNFKIGLGKVKFPNEVIFIGLFKPERNQTQGVFLGPRNQQGKPIWQNKGILEHYNWQKNIIIQKQPQKNETHSKKKLNKCNIDDYSEFQDEKGNIYRGQVINGNKQGYGTQETSEQIYQGQWRGNKRHGFGKLIVKNNFQIEGQWRDNVFISYHYSPCDDFF